MMKDLLWVLVPGVTLAVMGSASAQAGDVILNPGTLSGSVSIAGCQITSITVSAIDTVKVYSATATVSVPGGADRIDYVLTVEGDRDYYVMAEAVVSATDYTKALLPVTGPLHVPIGGDIPWDMSMDPAFICGTISTGSAANTLENYTIYTYVTVPEFDDPSYYHRTYASNLSVPGDTGRSYTLLLAPGAECTMYAYFTIDGLTYRMYEYGVVAPAAGETLYRDYTVDVTAASISGTVLLQGIDVTSASVTGYANSPYRTSYVPDVLSGLYTLAVGAGDWRLRPLFNFDLRGDLSGLTGRLYGSYTPALTMNAGDQMADVDFIIDPGSIPGTLNLWGANTDFYWARADAYEYAAVKHPVALLRTQGSFCLYALPVIGRRITINPCLLTTRMSRMPLCSRLSGSVTMIVTPFGRPSQQVRRRRPST